MIIGFPDFGSLSVDSLYFLRKRLQKTAYVDAPALGQAADISMKNSITPENFSFDKGPASSNGLTDSPWE